MPVDVIFFNKPDGKWAIQLVVGMTTDMHGDNVTALYRHSYLADTATTHQAIKLGQTSDKGAGINLNQLSIW